MKFEHTEVFNFEGAFRGMRNPKDSWAKSDSDFTDPKNPMIGQADMRLAQTLIKGGSEHRKFLRQIVVSVDITAPLYWWSEFDTYKVGTTANSTSTMHKLADTPITIECFESMINNLGYYFDDRPIQHWINYLEYLRYKYKETNDEIYWKLLVQLLPRSWLQTRTVTMNYENLLSMYKQRKNHKLTEWSVDFCNWIKTLPYAKELILCASDIRQCDEAKNVNIQALTGE